MSDFNPMSPDTGVLTFDVLRREDITGASGTGIVAMGALWPDGTSGRALRAGRSRNPAGASRLRPSRCRSVQSSLIRQQDEQAEKQE